MGLTINYSLQAQVSDVRARELVSALHRAAQDLPFKELDNIWELTGDQCRFEKRDPEDALRWLLIQAGAKVSLPLGVAEASARRYRIPPQRLIAFSTWPGEGCEEANFGLCQYPPVLATASGELKTGLSGWRWASFCKTEYASDPACGGMPNFLQCHLAVIALLDKAKELGCVAEVDDEGGFWEDRDIQALVQKAGTSNELLAALCGKLKDLAGERGGAIESPIAEYPNFEHLEAAGQGRLLPPEFEKLAGLIKRVSKTNRPQDP